jgi:hypothetical protein
MRRRCGFKSRSRKLEHAMPEEIASAIREAAQQPAEVAVDGQSVKQQPLPDQIEADRYLASKEAAKQGLGVRMTKIVPPGAV